ncbi:MAG: glycosyltransferase [Gemmataceae bacterium]|nr:glycosyltransferase [Gemmataceae bacterium]MDW8264211.1 glycosyltransferase [Gemmataceae bacterium]
MRIAIVVQRYGPDVLGGSEALARVYAHALAHDADVEVLTTCARDHVTWRNWFPAGTSRDGPVLVHRFRVSEERGPRWAELHGHVFGPVDLMQFARCPHYKRQLVDRLAQAPRSVQEELIRAQGPWPPDLLKFLGQHRHRFDVFLFCTYLYPTTCFGIRQVPAERTVLCPTLHDEPEAHLPLVGDVFAHVKHAIFLTEAERCLAREMHAYRGAGWVVGMGIPEPPPAGPPPAATPDVFVLYAGRIEPAKGLPELLDQFLAFKRRHPSSLRLVLIGKGPLPLPRHPDVVYLGFVSEPVKCALMARARALLHPSPFESFSIVLLESLRVGTPVLVNGHSAAMVEHCRASRAGLYYTRPEEFDAHLRRLINDEAWRQRLGQRGREYVLRNFHPDHIAQRLWRVVEAVSAWKGSRPRRRAAVAW